MLRKVFTYSLRISVISLFANVCLFLSKEKTFLFFSSTFFQSPFLPYTIHFHLELHEFFEFNFFVLRFSAKGRATYMSKEGFELLAVEGEMRHYQLRSGGKLRRREDYANAPMRKKIGS